MSAPPRKRSRRCRKRPKPLLSRDVGAPDLPQQLDSSSPPPVQPSDSTEIPVQDNWILQRRLSADQEVDPHAGVINVVSGINSSDGRNIYIASPMGSQMNLNSAELSADHDPDSQDHESFDTDSEHTDYRQFIDILSFDGFKSYIDDDDDDDDDSNIDSEATDAVDCDDKPVQTDREDQHLQPNLHSTTAIFN